MPKKKDKPAKGDKDGKSEKKNTSLRLDKKTLKALKLRAVEQDSSVQRIIEQLVEDYLHRPKRR